MLEWKNYEVPKVGDALCLQCWCGCQDCTVVARNPWKKFCVVACQECGTHYNWPRPANNVQDSRDCYFYSRSYPERYSGDAEVWAEGYVKQLRILLAKEGVHLEDFKHLLDVGCGGGQFVKVLHRIGVDAEGLDLDPQCVGFAQECQPGVTFYVGDLADLTVPPYDAIACMNVLEHAPNARDFAGKVLNKLVPGGYLLGVVPNIASVAFRLLNAYWTGMLSPSEHVTLFSPDTLGKCLTSAGFDFLQWMCVRSPVLTPFEGLRHFCSVIRRRGLASAMRYSVWWIVENLARVRTRLSGRADAGEHLFFVARKPCRH